MKKQWFMGLAVALGIFGTPVLGQYPGAQFMGGPYSGGQNASGQFQGNPYVANQNVGFGAQYGGSQVGNQLAIGSPAQGNLVAGGQYVGPYTAPNDALGASSYPVTTQSILQNVPQVPSGFGAQGSASPQYYGNPNPGGQTGQYQFVAAQNQVYSQPQTAETVPSPAAQYQNPQYPNGMASPPNGAGVEMAPMAQMSPMAPSAPMSQGCQSCSPSMPSYFTPNSAPTFGYGFQPGGTAPNCASCGPMPVSNPYARTGHQPLFSGMPAFARPWYFGAGAVIFNRVDCHDIPLAFFDSSYSGNTITTRDARQQATGGVEATIGRYFNCGRNAVEFNYWGIFPGTQSVTRARVTAGDYRSRLPFAYMMMPGTPAAPATPYAAYDWYDNGFAHALTRSSEYYSFEVNLVGFAAGCAARNFNCATKNIFGGSGCGTCGGSGCSDCATACAPACNTCQPPKFATGPCCLTPPACGSRLNLTWLAGFRYFRFDDNLLFAASLNDSVINRSADDLYYEVNTTNELAGFQAGTRLDFCLHKRFNLYGNTKVGIYNNHSTLYSRLGTDFNYAYLDDTRTPVNPSNGQNYMFSEMKDQVAFLSEIGAGVGYRICCSWTATLGYRAIIASGVATSPGNVQSQFANYDHIRDFNNCDTLILHGFTVGGVYNF